MYHLLSGKTPYHGSSPTEVLKHHVMDPLPPITELKADVPPKVVLLLERMMAKKPEERLQTATEVIDELRKLAGAESGTERIGGETLILRRYAKGGPAAASIPTPASLTTGSRTPGGETTTPEGTASVEGDQRLRLLNRVLAGAIALVVLICAILFARSLFAKPTPAQTPGATGAVATTGGATQPQPGTTGTATPPQPAPGADAEARKAKTAAALGDLEAQLSRDGDKADTNALRQSVDKITDENIDPDNLDRAKALMAKIEALVQKRRTQGVLAAFETLKKDVAKLADDHDYDNALARLDAFKDRRDPAVKVDFDKLRAQTDRAKNEYLSDLTAKIRDAAASKDAVRLKQIRDSLPPALLGSASEAEIVKALKAIDDDKQKEYLGVVATAGKDLAAWKFQQVDSSWRSNRPLMGNGSAGAQFDQYHDAEQKLTAMVTAIGAKLRAMRSIRYHGTLKGSEDPDLVDANLDDGLSLVPPSGGNINLKWQSLSPDDVGKVLDLVLGHDGEGYKPAIATLAAAKAAAGPAK
jgi:hypothetical protein